MTFFNHIECFWLFFSKNHTYVRPQSHTYRSEFTVIGFRSHRDRIPITLVFGWLLTFLRSICKLLKEIFKSDHEFPIISSQRNYIIKAFKPRKASYSIRPDFTLSLVYRLRDSTITGTVVSTIMIAQTWVIFFVFLARRFA